MGTPPLEEINVGLPGPWPLSPLISHVLCLSHVLLPHDTIYREALAQKPEPLLAPCSWASKTVSQDRPMFKK
jgi:hypothetical protein